MSLRYLTGKLFGRSKTTKMLQSPKLDSKSRSKTPLFAKDSNSPHWPRIYEKAIRNGDPSIGEESLKQRVAQQVRLRKELRARKQAKQTATKYRGEKKSRRKSRKLLSIFY